MPVQSLGDIALSQMPKMASTVATDISIALLGKQLDTTQQMGAEMIKAMERSVNPDVGGNIDVYV